MSKKTKSKPKKGSDLSYLLSENLNKEQKEKLNQIKSVENNKIKIENITEAELTEKELIENE